MKNFNIDEFVIDDVLEDQKKLMKKKSKEKKKKANRSDEEVIADEIVKDKKKEEKKRQREDDLQSEANADSRFYYWKKSLEDRYGKAVYTREEFLAYRPDLDNDRPKSDYVIVDENGDILKKKDVLKQKDKMVINISL